MAESSPTSATREASTGEPARQALGHVVPVRILVAVCGALLLLTYLTVAATGFEMGVLNLWIALVIATIKASLVALYFMHLRYDQPFHAIVFITALLFVALFVGLALMDTVQYRADLIPGYAPALQRE